MRYKIINQLLREYLIKKFHGIFLMELYKAIITRRSIRHFMNKEISKESIEAIIKAAMYAPSARNYQPWHFIVINQRELLDKIPSIHPYAEMMLEAEIAVLVCGDREIEKMDEYIVVDCAAATQNLLLAAHDLGLGTVWLGVYPRKERIEGLSRLLRLPGNILPVSLIAIGYPSEHKEMPERFKPERIHYNSWMS